MTKRRRALWEGQAELQRLGVPIEVAADLLDPQPVPNAWHELARPSQLPPAGDWSVWLILAGRGFGKTRTGAGWLAEQVRQAPGRSEWAVMAPTYRDVRDVCVEGSSGLLAALGKDQVLRYNRSIGEVDLRNGAKVFMVSADEPDRILGRNLSGAWCDELASWAYPETWYRGLVVW